VHFFVRDYEPLFDHARADLAAFIHADPEDLAWVTNATTGANTVLRSLRLNPGDEILITNHAYNACRNAAEHYAGQAGARVVVAAIPFPIRSPDEVVARVLAAVTPRTRLAMLEHVTSPTALVFPIADLVRTLAARGIDTLVDGAHAPGMLLLDVSAIGAAYYTGNCHKWLCAPKGAGFLHVRRDRQSGIHPLSVSHGANSPRSDRSRFLLEFDWTGTSDPTPWLCVPQAIRVVGGLRPGGWPQVMAENRALALRARAHLASALEIPPPCPDTMIGSMASLPLPPGSAPASASGQAQVPDPIQEALYARHAIEVPIQPWPAPPAQVLRISANLYNHMQQYEKLADALAAILRQRAVPR
jgi:isopenicillin-N epimerase